MEDLTLRQNILEAVSVEILRILSMENQNGKSVAIAIGAKPLVVPLFGHLFYLMKVIWKSLVIL